MTQFPRLALKGVVIVGGKRIERSSITGFELITSLLMSCSPRVSPSAGDLMSVYLMAQFGGIATRLAVSRPDLLCPFARSFCLSLLIGRYSCQTPSLPSCMESLYFTEDMNSNSPLSVITFITPSLFLNIPFP